jgi:hypothetical protein
MPKNAAILPHHKKCDAEANKRLIKSINYWYGCEEEED